MFTSPNVDPVAITIGLITIRWYGICYVIGFLICYFLSIHRSLETKWNSKNITDILFFVVIGTIIGGRIGYILFYFPKLIYVHPLVIFKFWEPGRSFHGGLIGVILALLIYVKFNLYNFLELTDFIAPVVPIGLGLGRLGNFINAELYGRVTTLYWGMVFPNAGPIARHPSQLYEFLLEGIILYFGLFLYTYKTRKIGTVSGMFLFWYGIMRSLVEFVREPDVSHGLILFNFFTMGQLLSIPMIIVGLYIVWK